jgi:flagellar hook-associated protein 3 FlgL
MRVTDSARLTATTAGLATAAERLLEFQRQVSSGKRVSRASDDPSAVSTTILERGSQASIERYLHTAESAKSRLLTTDTVLSDMIEQLDASQVAILGARGTIRTPAQREAAAKNLEQLRDAVLRDLNTSFRGGHIFGGAQGSTVPYVKNGAGGVSSYQGSTVEVAVDVSQEHEVAVVFNGESVAKGADATDVFAVFDQAIAAVRAGDEAGMSGALDGLSRALGRVTELQIRVGASLRAIEDDVLQLQSSERASSARVSSLEDANMAAAVSGMTQAETTYRAALGVAAQLNRLSLMDYLK